MLDNNQVMKNNLQSEIRNMYASNKLLLRLEYISDNISIFYMLIGEDNKIKSKQLINDDYDNSLIKPMGRIKNKNNNKSFL